MMFVRAIALLAAATVSATSVQAQEIFDNKTLGISASKPKTWVTITDTQNRANISKLKMSNAEFQKYVLKHARAPIFAITKHREPYDDLNPSVKITVRPLGRVTKDSILSFAAVVARALAKNIGGAIKIETPKLVQISGFPGAYTSIDYTLKTQAGLSFPTRSQIWLVMKGQLLVMIGAGTRIDEATGSRKEIQEIINTIRLY
jgi:hypothetical protein